MSGPAIPPEDGAKTQGLPKMWNARSHFDVETNSLGLLRFYEPNLNDLKLIDSFDNPDTTSNIFVSELICLLGRKVADIADPSSSTELAMTDVSLLEKNDRYIVVSKLLSLIIDLCNGINIMSDKSASHINNNAKYNFYLENPRLDNESDEDYLLRAWKVYKIRLANSMGETIKKFHDYFGKLDSLIEQPMISDFISSAKASSDITKLISKLRLDIPWNAEFAAPNLVDINKLAGAQKQSFDAIPKAGIAESLIDSKDLFLKIPRNPTYETNDILSRMSENIENMAGIAARTAEMQQLINDATWRLLGAFNTSSKTSNSASKRALTVSVISAAAAIIAVLLNVFDLYHSKMDRVKSDNVTSSQHAEDLTARRNETEATLRLARAIEDSLTARKSTPKRSANRRQMPVLNR